jgi:acyl carrier protein
MPIFVMRHFCPTSRGAGGRLLQAGMVRNNIKCVNATAGSKLAEFASWSRSDADGLQTYCIDFVAALLERAPSDIDPNAKFNRIGFDSAMSVQLILALEELLGAEVSPDLIETYPTIARLTAHLATIHPAPSRDR